MQTEELAKAEARIVKYKRHADSLAARAQQAEARAREAETADARHVADLERVTKRLVQGQEDLKTSERHGEMLGRKLSEAVTALAKVQAENEELHQRYTAHKTHQAVSSLFPHPS